MRVIPSLLGSALFLVLAPGCLAGLIPFLLTDWTVAMPLFGIEGFRWLGCLLLLCGIILLLDCFFLRFAWQGRGTPAPLAPPASLVITGPYRHVRNAMYLAVALILLGQELIFCDEELLIYSLFTLLGFHLFVIFYEEPKLRRSFGPDYDEYCRHVPRWLPRMRAWRP